MRIVWAAEARQRTHEIWHYIALDNPGAANRIFTRLVAAVEKLAHYPYLGRPGRKSTRELAVAGTPFIVVYRLKAEEIRIVTVLHGAQRVDE
ncbi:MAG: type II toxin-antitoxin system RelE/ParE family toxin [Terriglobia bacterium]|jgi:toxin ParE1/3/4